jgi:hypothetical protein
MRDPLPPSSAPIDKLTTIPATGSPLAWSRTRQRTFRNGDRLIVTFTLSSQSRSFGIAANSGLVSGAVADRI